MKAVIAFVCVVLLVVSASAEGRTWRDKTGKFSIGAELVESERTPGGLKSKDGKVVRVPIDRLSDQDRQFVGRKRGQNSFGFT